MPSKQVIDRERSARTVAAAATTHAATVAQKFHDAFAPFARPGDPMPGPAAIEALITTIGRAIIGKNQALVAADKAHEAELADDAPYRETRDEKAEQVRGMLVDIRSLVSTGYRDPGLVALGLSDAISQDTTALLAQGRSVLEQLRDPAVLLPEPRRPSLAVDRAVLANELEAAVLPLAEMLDHLAREKREAELTLREKHAAMNENDHMFTHGASWLAATFATSGLDDLAQRVRPSRRRPGRTATETETPDGETPSDVTEPDGTPDEAAFDDSNTASPDDARPVVPAVAGG